MATDTLVRIGALLVDGLSIGLLYVMLGLGITLVFGLGGILNLALGAFTVITILLTFELTGSVPVVAAAVIAIAATAAFGLFLDRTLLQLVDLAAVDAETDVVDCGQPTEAFGNTANR